MKRLNIEVFIEDNTSSDFVEESYNEAMVEAVKTKKIFEQDTPEKSTYSNWRKWENSEDKYLSAKFNFSGVSLSYVIRRDEVTETSDPEHCRIIAAPLTGAFYKRHNIEVHKFLKSLTQVTEAWRWIDKFRVGIQ